MYNRKSWTLGARDRSDINPWVIAGTVMLATFMEVLDTSVANVALPHIAGSLSSSVDEATWVLTAYLVANAIVLPLSGWFSTLFGRKRFYMTCVAAVHAEFRDVRPGAEPDHADPFPRAARAGRRRAAARFASHPARDVPARKARHGDGGVRHGRGVRARGRADAGRLDHRQLYLALDFPDQHPGRDLFSAVHFAADLRSALSTRARAWRRPAHRLHRPGAARHRLRRARNHAGRRPAQRLVLFARDRRRRGHRRRRL